LTEFQLLAAGLLLPSFRLAMSQNMWFELGALILKKRKSISRRQFKLAFKLDSALVTLIWRRLLSAGFTSLQPKHLLWTLHLLRTTNTNHQQVATALHTSIETLVEHTTTMLKCLDSALPEVSLYLFFAEQFDFVLTY
jgi:hypothetical protein